jgi:hypothetical protein
VVGFESTPKGPHKTVVEFHKIQPVFRLQDPYQSPGDRARTRPHFENPPTDGAGPHFRGLWWNRRLPDIPHQGGSQPGATGQNRTGGVKIPQELPEEQAVFPDTLPHRNDPLAGGTERKQESSLAGVRVIQ